MQEERYANITIVRGRETLNFMHIERYALRQNAIREVLLYIQYSLHPNSYILEQTLVVA